jgi:nucleoside-diphosphate-sugar epimerase
MKNPELSLPCQPHEVDDFLSNPSLELIPLFKRIKGDFIVLGAAGKMGLHVCMMIRKALDSVEDKRRVIAVSRFSNPTSKYQFEENGITCLPCDLSDPLQVSSLELVENIIFMAGAKFGTSQQPGLLNQMNVEMPKLVASHFRKSRITAFSTGCVYPFFPINSEGPKENIETTPVGAYAESCVGRERAFLEAAKTFQTKVSIIRLNYAVEFRYGVAVDLATKILAGEVINLAMGHVNIIWQRDAILHSLMAHEKASEGGFIINVTRPEILKIKDLAESLGKLLGREPRFEGKEAPTAWISNPSKAVKLFGQPETSIDKILEYVAAWKLRGLPSLNKPTGFDKRDGNF